MLVFYVAKRALLQSIVKEPGETTPAQPALIIDMED